LPGIGRYAAGAILSLAFGFRLPIVEANSARVLCRLFACQKDVKSTHVRQWLWRAAESLLPARRVGEFNQALMELGALVCTPRQPRCDTCPLADCCAARARGWQENIPRKSPTPNATRTTEAAVVIRRREGVLLVQRPATGRWANLWEFPHGEVQDGETYAAAGRRLCRELTGLQVRGLKELATIRHGITRYAVTVRCFAGQSSTGRFRSRFYQQGRWVRPVQLADFPLSVPQRKIARTLLNGQT
jgi:A/G-specific adenine glycosylase